MDKLKLVLLLIIFSHNSLAITKDVKVNHITIKSDSLEIKDNGRLIEFCGNVIVSFKEYVLYTNKIILHINIVNKKQEIEQALILQPLKVINTNFPEDFMTAKSAIYYGQTKTLEASGSVNLRREGSLIVTDNAKFKIKN